ncbi:MAG: hypothetical protein LBC61_00115 [Candidatus Peribacteria bacterium]|nr:hypothetical protein [Candidatus Peribacteria bacterium]
MYNNSIFKSFHSRDFSTFEIESNLSLKTPAICIANSGIQIITSPIFQKYFIHSGKIVLTKIAIFHLAFRLSSFSFIIQESCQVLVFLLSQTIVQTGCHKLFFTT